MSALPRFSDVDLFGYSKRVVHLDPQIADRTLNLRVAKQERPIIFSHSANEMVTIDPLDLWAAQDGLFFGGFAVDRRPRLPRSSLGKSL
jgi:hypothetical protein